jgi:hypothetical protein
MRLQRSSTDPLVAPAQVWGGLTTETRAGAIRLMARLASNLVSQGFDSAHRIAPEHWPHVLHDHHPAYITWDQFQRNQRQLIDNCTSQHQDHRGAIRKGAALLQGLVLCGRCGRRMTIRYMDDGHVPLYECNQLHKHLGEKTCQSLRGDGIDAAVAAAFLEAMRPAE